MALRISNRYKDKIIGNITEQLTSSGNSTKYDIARITRLIELSGFFVSAIALIVSLGIFSRFRALRNQRTLIHTCMFWTMLAQSLVRILIYLDQMYFRGSFQNTNVGIEHENTVCIVCYCLLEYIITATIVWHLIEGIYLFEFVQRSMMRPDHIYRRFFFVGWGLPAFITLAWGMANMLYYRAEKVKTCWYGYNFLPTYWICQLPRFLLIAINFFFLLGIMRVIITKLQIASNSELERCRRTVKAAMLLLPLLGFPNILNMIEVPLNLVNWSFAVWMYSIHFLTSYQGMFLACIYCFTNREVQNVITRNWRNIRQQRQAGRAARNRRANARARNARDAPRRASDAQNVNDDIGNNDVQRAEGGQGAGGAQGANGGANGGQGVHGGNNGVNNVQGVNGVNNGVNNVQGVNGGNNGVNNVQGVNGGNGAIGAQGGEAGAQGRNNANDPNANRANNDQRPSCARRANADGNAAPNENEDQGVNVDENAQNAQGLNVDENAQIAQGLNVDENAQNAHGVNVDENAQNAQAPNVDEDPQNAHGVNVDEDAQNAQGPNVDEDAQNAHVVNGHDDAHDDHGFGLEIAIVVHDINGVLVAFNAFGIRNHHINAHNPGAGGIRGAQRALNAPGERNPQGAAGARRQRDRQNPNNDENNNAPMRNRQNEARRE